MIANIQKVKISFLFGIKKYTIIPAVMKNICNETNIQVMELKNLNLSTPEYLGLNLSNPILSQWKNVVFINVTIDIITAYMPYSSGVKSLVYIAIAKKLIIPGKPLPKK